MTHQISPIALELGWIENFNKAYEFYDLKLAIAVKNGQIEHFHQRFQMLWLKNVQIHIKEIKIKTAGGWKERW